MLEISKITTTVTHKEDWLKARLGKITASQAGKLIGEKSDKGIFKQTALSYLDGLCHEIITGERYQEEFFTNATNFGNANEPFAVEHFCKLLGKSPMINPETKDTHRLIVLDEYCGLTPDALLPLYNDVNKLFDETGTKIKVSPLEVKCPPKNFLKLYRCETPAQLKIVEPIYYWQVMFQMYGCNSLNAYFGVYHPSYPKQRLIQFKQIELIADIKFLKNTLDFAKLELQKTVNLFKN
jgi:hypothetical protein